MKNLSKPLNPVFTDLLGLIEYVKPGMSIGVGGHHFARLPIAQLGQIVARKIGPLEYFSWAGGLALEILLEADLVKKANICFSSLDIFGLPTRFRNAVESQDLEVIDWAALTMIQALRAAQQNLPFMPFQLPLGSDLMQTMPGVKEVTESESGIKIGMVKARKIDVFLLHATRADTHGNIELVGARALDMAMIGAAKNVLVSVEEIVPAGTFQNSNRHSVILRNQVTAIAKVPGGAFPTSCLPNYTTNYTVLNNSFRKADTSESLLNRLEKKKKEELERSINVAQISIDRLNKPLLQSMIQDDSFTVEEYLVCRLAQEFNNQSHVSAGAVSPLANVSYRLAKKTHAPDMMITAFSGGHIDIEPFPLTLSLVEKCDMRSSVAHMGGDESYSIFYQAGSVSHEIVGAAQVDKKCRVNNISIPRDGKPDIRLPGQGGMADVANMHEHSIIYVPRHSKLALIESVNFSSAARGLISKEDRESVGYRSGKVKLFTNLCVFVFDEELDQLVVTELSPGVSEEEVVDSTGFVPIFSKNLVCNGTPDMEMLRILRQEIDPLGLRRLEFVPARERQQLLDEIIENEIRWLDRLTSEN